VYIGTYLDNIRDSIEAGTHISVVSTLLGNGRQVGSMHWRRLDPERSRHHQARLKHPFVLIQQIRHLAFAGFPVSVLARIFGFRDSYISAIVQRKIRLDR
jgi:hypothetical protein